ncbi:MAG TPA: MotA/TolQ/ExbB proton channel family protein [Bacteriovoracaceae bacterium]|nr:MotA/TolQ/ExbB proton channel family protein [Bacteriovoracaceae bacterium]
MLWITVIEWLARLILVLLVGLSVWSVTIIIDRKRFFSALKLPGEKLKEDIKARRIDSGKDHIYSELLTDLTKLKRPEQIDKAFDAFAFQKRKELEKGLPVLGTLGSTTPFIGLLGTILGIIVSFGELSRGTGSTNSVMFSLAEALILTALGLIVAIPAVVAYNYFNRRSRLIISEAASLKDLYVAYRD